MPIQEAFPNEQLFKDEINVPWYVDFVNFLVCGVLPPDLLSHQRKKFLYDAKSYLWDDPLLLKRCLDKIVRRYVPMEKVPNILHYCHSLPYGGHFGPTRTATKVLQSGFCGPSIFKDCYFFVKTCDRC